MSKRLIMWVALLFLLPASVMAQETHGLPTVAQEQRAWFGEAMTGYAVADCLGTTGVGGATTHTFATCRGYVLNTDTPRQLEYVADANERVVDFSGGDGTYWLIFHASATGGVGGWTQSPAGSHYYWQKVTTQPVLPSRAMWLAKYTLASSAITERIDYRSSNPYAANVLSVTDPLWGAIPNDELDDAIAIQAAMTAAKRGNVTIKFPPGNYDALTQQCPEVQGEYQTSTAVCIDESANVIVNGEGATFRAGNTPIRLMGVYGSGSTQVTIKGFRMVGHTQTISEHKHGIVVAHNASHVRIENNYITNFLGDCILTGGNMENGTVLGHTSTFVTIAHNTCKIRVGNGTSSVSGGTMSRVAMAVTDSRYVTIEDNTIFGLIDLEPDVDDQWMFNIVVRNNTFSSGPVTPQSTIGTTYLHDEPILAPDGGGTVIVGGVTFVGIPGEPVVGLVQIKDNTFQRGQIVCGVGEYVCDIIGNRFHEGLIQLSSTSGTGSLDIAHVEGNITRLPYPAKTTFIELLGFVTFGSFIGNVAWVPSGYTIADTGASTGDNGRNIFLNNVNRGIGALGVLDFVPAATSVAGDNAYERQLTFNTGISQRTTFTTSMRLVPLASPPTAPEVGDVYMDDSLAFCWFTDDDPATWTKISGAGTCE